MKNEKKIISVEQVIETRKELNVANVKMSIMLDEVSENRHYIDWGFKSMNDFITSTTNLDPKVAKDFVCIGKFIRVNELPDDALLDLEWEKVKLIVRAKELCNTKYDIPVLPELTAEELFNSCIKKGYLEREKTASTPPSMWHVVTDK